jgi:2-keto-4-pentenoate hydratase/2-oxohepta-3-ene-1,7-dioic acid hydratase in catechol pathway
LHSDQIFSIRRVISHLSQGTTLEPGSIILTGTPKGVGYINKPPAYLKHGDRVDTWMGADIGTLVNNVEEEGHAD